MRARAIFLRHRSLRWVVPAGLVGAIALAAAGAFSASASTNLPPRSAAQLLADLESAKVDGLSGTIVSTADLGLPALPSIGGSSAGSSPIGLLSGSHTARIWCAGPTKQRVALLDAVGEFDLFHNGTDVWQWSSADKTATHTTLPASGAAMQPDPTTLTPDQLAKQALAAIGPTTVVTTDANRRVADRSAYELVLTPRDTSSRIGSVKIAIDGEKKIPMGVRIYARGDTASPALDVSFTRISFSVPDNDNFAWTPPKGAIVNRENPSAARPTAPRPDVHAAVQTFGTGWTTILQTRITPNPKDENNTQVLGALRAVSGTWGSGRLFESKLLTGLITDDGRVFVGAVDPQVLYAAAAAHK
ncbi:MAG: hypothetical protein ABJB98_03135 [Actinomycetota bacterium]